MKLGIKHVAVAAALVFGAVSATPATVQAQVITSAQVQARINAILVDGAASGPALAALNALIAANPTLAGAIAAAAGARAPTLAAAIGGEVAKALAASGLSAAEQEAQMTVAAEGLATANPGDAVAIFQNVAAAAPALAAAASGGVTRAPGVNPTVVANIVQLTAPAAGPAPPPPPPPPQIVKTVAPPEKQGGAVS